MSDLWDEEEIPASGCLPADAGEPGPSTRSQVLKGARSSVPNPPISILEWRNECNLRQLKQQQIQLELLQLQRQQLQLPAQTDEPPGTAGRRLVLQSLPSASTWTRGEPTAGGSGSTGEQVHRSLSPSAANAKLACTDTVTTGLRPDISDVSEAKLQERGEQLQLKWKQMHQEQLQHSREKTSHQNPSTSTRGEPTAGGSGSTGEQVSPTLGADPNPNETFEVKHREKWKQLQLEERQFQQEVSELQREIWGLQREMFELQSLQEQSQHLKGKDEPPGTAAIGIKTPTPLPLHPLRGSPRARRSGLSFLKILRTNQQGEPTSGGSGLTGEQVHPPVSPTSVADPKLIHESCSEMPVCDCDFYFLVFSMSERLQEQQRQPTEEEQQQLQHLEGEDGPSHFTPEVSKDHGGISYRFRGPGPGVFQCDMTKLAFRMTRAGELTYRVVRWDVDMLHAAGKTPAGLLFDIKCPEDAVSQLHLPHCETDLAPLSEGLSVVHISDGDGMSILKPQEITDTHVIVDVPHLSAFGLVKGQLEEAEPIVAPSFCYLIRNQTYIVDCPQADLVQPVFAEYDFNYGPNYHPTFEIRLTKCQDLAVVKVQDQEKRHVWEYNVELTGPDPRGQILPRRGNYEEKLSSVRTEFIARVSTSVLKDLMDALLQNKVINDRERESIPAAPRADKARELINMVIRKGDPACRLLIETFCKAMKRVRTEQIQYAVSQYLKRRQYVDTDGSLKEPSCSNQPRRWLPASQHNLCKLLTSLSADRVGLCQHRLCCSLSVRPAAVRGSVLQAALLPVRYDLTHTHTHTHT
ncbi:hypothetical protein INR49_018313 [Caranx melampygus]|nr:hypothetical protein INR49_018313 [Caranx melampygus]